jgi:hypothetical protein
LPVRARDLIRALARFGVTVTSPRGGSSHWIAKKAGAAHPLPMHNGDKTELSDVYLRGVCSKFGIDLTALKKEL